MCVCAGAGSIIEAIRAKKKLVVVVNPNLMHNHQTEIAREMSDRGILTKTHTHYLIQSISEALSHTPSVYPPPDTQPFHNLIFELTGVCTTRVRHTIDTHTHTHTAESRYTKPTYAKSTIYT
eukprot:GHVR01143307.1.p1 GENE.GHVR01143307.1~~GHVR01143307.1.p1  ORF type:complete len:122 (-),score=49.11 GHVR01143307.1:38-403(-)